MTSAALTEGEVTVTINGVPFEGVKVIQYSDEARPAPSPFAMSSFSFEGVFETTQSARDRLLHWCDLAQFGRYWLRRRDYWRGRAKAGR